MMLLRNSTSVTELCAEQGAFFKEYNFLFERVINYDSLHRLGYLADSFSDDKVSLSLQREQLTGVTNVGI